VKYAERLLRTAREWIPRAAQRVTELEEESLAVPFETVVAYLVGLQLEIMEQKGQSDTTDECRDD